MFGYNLFRASPAGPGTLCWLELSMDRARIERISKALADETRLLLFEAIAQADELNCGQLCSLRDVTPATISHHLRVLNDAGLIETRKEGQFVYSRACTKTLEEYGRAVANLASHKRRS